MIHWNKNENDNCKIGHINKTYINQDVDIETNTESIVFLGKTMPLCNKQQAMFEAQFNKKLSNTET